MKPLDEAIDAVATFGFSRRQARFLTVVMRHTGLCLPRQYATFAGTSYGRKVNDFFARLVDDGWASSWPCVHNRARLYHVHHKALYRAIGDAESRFRRAVSARAVTGRIERLDALLTVPSTSWFATFEELAEALARVTRDTDAEVLDLARRATATRGDQGPVVGIDETRRLVLLYVADGLSSECGELVRPAFPLLRCVPRWSIHLALGAAQTALVPELVRAVTTALAPVPEAGLTDLRWYFQERQRGPAAERDRATAERLDDARWTYQDGPYEALYRAWVDRGEDLFEELSSTVLQEAYARFQGRVQAHVLPRTYRHLDPLLGPRRSRRLGVGAHTPEALSTPSSTRGTLERGGQPDLPHSPDAPRMRLTVSGLRIGGARTGSRRRTPKQPSLFAPGGKERV
jgi:hypothetical protein